MSGAAGPAGRPVAAEGPLMRFLHPELLWLLALIPFLLVAILFLERRRRIGLRRFAAGVSGAQLTRHLQAWGQVRQGLLGVIALALLIVAAARPQVPAGKVPVQRLGRDVAILLDVSASMLAEDLPGGRLAYARRTLKGLLEEMDGDRIGLVAFAGEAYVQCPLTLDRSALHIFLDAVGTDVVGQAGTALAQAIRRGLDVVGERRDRTRVLLLMTDAEDHGGEIEEALEEARHAGVHIVAVGLGTAAGEPIPVPQTGGDVAYKRDAEGRVVMSRLHEALLRDLAAATGGFYVRATGNGSEQAPLQRFLASLERGEVEG
ncbi:MAG: VWA domain-containing protein, partial [Candidatus Eisenbacteria bacterium]|nr:VWA domain-containing protein [Candidatus Eisenbacteria bacterium]